jgi:hypothetical protein
MLTPAKSEGKKTGNRVPIASYPYNVDKGKFDGRKNATPDAIDDADSVGGGTVVR